MGKFIVDFLFLAGENFSCGGFGLFTFRRSDTLGAGSFDKSFKFLLIELGNVFTDELVEGNFGVEMFEVSFSFH